MIDKYLENLKDAPLDFQLDNLEVSVWLRVAADEQMLRNRKLMLGWQAAIVALVVMGGLTVGGAGASADNNSSRLDPFSVNGGLAPSTLLLGSQI